MRFLLVISRSSYRKAGERPEQVTKEFSMFHPISIAGRRRWVLAAFTHDSSLESGR